MCGQHSDEQAYFFPEHQPAPSTPTGTRYNPSPSPQQLERESPQELQHRLNAANVQLTTLLHEAVARQQQETLTSASADVPRDWSTLSSVRNVCGTLLGTHGSVILVPGTASPERAEIGATSAQDFVMMPPQEMQRIVAICSTIALASPSPTDSAACERWHALSYAREQLAIGTGERASAVMSIPVFAANLPAALLILPCGSALDVAPYLPTLQLAQAVLGAAITLERQAAETRARNAAYDAFLSLTAHELRSPLTAVKGYAQLLARQGRKVQLPDLVLRSTEAIEQQAARMGAMIDELHDAARIRRGVLEVHLTETDLVAVVQEAAEQWRLEYPTHTFGLDLPIEHVVLHSDERRIRQALHALADNAVRYSPGHATVTVSVWTDGTQAVIAVKDQGLGIAAADTERIFEYLYRSPLTDARNLSGLGLGLFVSRNLIERLGGHLDLHETTPVREIGSEFRVTLPLSLQHV